MDDSTGFQGNGDSRDPALHHHQLPGPTLQQPQLGIGGGRKKGTACVRCRNQKVRCDDGVPSCANCARAGRPCVRAKGCGAEAIRLVKMSPYPSKQSSYTRMTLLLCLAANRKSSYIAQVEARLRSLEDTLRKVAPEELEKAPVVGIPADGGAIPHPIASQQPVSDPCPRGGPTPCLLYTSPSPRDS